MHEHSLIKNLITRVTDIAGDENADKLVSIKVKLGALSHISAEHFREHFENETQGTILEGVELEVEELSDLHDPLAQEIILESLEIEDNS